MSNGVIPFSCGTQYMNWCDRNCFDCAKQSDFETYWEEITCDIEKAIVCASICEGGVTDEIAERMGYDSKAYCWPCPEYRNKVTGDPWPIFLELAGQTKLELAP